ncbi:type II/IV secretion system protein [Candidatus Parcubacteria bacterium]|nr:type II/IV secretion system protein [Candidatus Parcubacteria bacterium]
MNSKNLKKAYEYLISNNVAPKDIINSAFEKSEKDRLDIFNVLIDKKEVPEEDLTKIKADFLGVPYIKLKDDSISSQVLKEIPEKAVLFYKFVPFEKNDETVKVAMIDPNNTEALDALKFISIKHKVNTEIYLISRSGFYNIIKQYKKIDDELKTVLQSVDRQIIDKEESLKKGKKKKKGKNIKKAIEEAPVSRIVDIVLTHAIEGKASDIHIEPNENELRVRYRLDGVLHNSLVLPKKITPAVTSRIKILADLKIDETRKPQDGRFRFDLSKGNNLDKSVDLRVSTFPTVNGEKVVMRILDTSSDISTLENLGIWRKGLQTINDNINKPFGIILVTGPTGSGKSTTLYAMMKILNKEGVNIVTLEDPVEYFMVGVNQSQIRSEIGYTFSSGLRSILRQDPDIIMVGEIRDKETAELATHAALTGHLVLSTLHTNNAIGVIPRLIDMGVEPFLISSSLNIAIAQRLVKKICSYCKEEIAASLSMEKIIRKELESVPDDQKKDIDIKNNFKLFHGKGCKECKQSGFSGRIGVYEVLLMTPELESVMSSNISDTEISKEAKRQGMITMKQDGIIKALFGITTIEEVLRVTEE